MSELKRYIIVAGINGAGKSTLYRARPELFTHSKRLNADEILQKMGSDWHKDRDNFRAMREEIKQLHAALDTGQSIHVETTLSGQGKAQLNLIDRAHQNGFEVTLLYVALKNEKVAINRVHERVKKGGHGVPDEVVKKRYNQSNQNLAAVAFKADNDEEDLLNVLLKEILLEGQKKQEFSNEFDVEMICVLIQGAIEESMLKNRASFSLEKYRDDLTRVITKIVM